MRRGKPEDEIADYAVLNINGTTVYAHKSLEEYGPLEIDSENGWFGENLTLHSPVPINRDCCG